MNRATNESPLTQRYRGFSVAGVLTHRATTDPEGVFLVSGGRRFAFGEIDGQAESLAASLSNLGVEPGDRVSIVLPGCAEFVVSLFAIARIGAVAVPLDPRAAESELRYTIRHSGAVCAVVPEMLRGVDYLQMFDGFLEVLPELGHLVTVGVEERWHDDRIFQFEDLVSAGMGRDFRAPEIDPESTVFSIVYTSGTMGKPKGVELTHRNLVHAAAATAELIALDSTDRIVGVTALFPVFGLGPGLLGAVLSGAGLVLQPELDAGETLDLIESERATVHYGVPTVFAAEIREQRNRPRDVSSLRVGIAAGAPMPEDLMVSVEEELCPTLLTAYSLTEAASTVSATTVDDLPQRRRSTVGSPVAETEVRVMGPGGVVLPLESIGELGVRGPGVMKGYFRQPKETSMAFDRDGFLRSGDVGMIDEDGYIHLVGRSQGVIIRGGSNVYPREVEDRLHAHPAIQEAAVVGLKDELLGEALCAAILLVEGAVVTEDEIREWCRGTLAEHKVPDEVAFLDQFPMTGTGKVRRVDLARLLGEARWDSSQ